MERTGYWLHKWTDETSAFDHHGRWSGGLDCYERDYSMWIPDRIRPDDTVAVNDYIDKQFELSSEVADGLEVIEAADAQATIAALQEKLTAALKVKADYDRWLSGGVYFTTAEYEKHAEEHRQREAALQARVKELEEWVQDQSTANLETMRHVDEMQSRAMDAESQLTQRTAERDTARRRVDELETREVDVVLLRDDLEQRTAECDALKLVNDTHMKTVMKLSHIVEQQTAELEAVKADTKNMLDVATRRLHEQVNDLQAELDRVRAEHNAAGEELQREVNTLNHLLRNVGLGQGEIDGMAADLEELTTLRTLVLALPKVEGEIRLIHADDGDWHVVDLYDAIFTDKSWAVSYAALLQHRQGMG